MYYLLVFIVTLFQTDWLGQALAKHGRLDLFPADRQFSAHLEASNISRQGPYVLIRMRSSVVDGFKLLNNGKCILSHRCSWRVATALLVFSMPCGRTEEDSIIMCWEGYFQNVFRYRIQNTCPKMYFVTYSVTLLNLSFIPWITSTLNCIL